MQKLTPAAAAHDLAAILSSVEVDDQEYVIVRDGKPIARIIPVHDPVSLRSKAGAPRTRRRPRDTSTTTAMSAAVSASRWVNRRAARA